MNDEYTGNEIKCPYCEQAQMDPWDLYDEDGDYECECQECGKRFAFTVKTEVWATSRKIKKAQRSA